MPIEKTIAALGGTGKMVILPVDQGFEHGLARSFAPNPPAYDPRYHFELGIGAGRDAEGVPGTVLVAPTLMKSAADKEALARTVLSFADSLS